MSIVNFPAPIISQRGIGLFQKHRQDIMFVVLWGLIISVALAVCVGLPISQTKHDDKTCTDLYGKGWDHQTDMFTGGIEHTGPYCVNIQTKEVKDIK